ncbi:MAG: DUF4292 domain-containing protein [Chitinophagales bacterium]|nr:DUF4292 domain-containing protein [Chitinophagales bacterium]
MNKIFVALLISSVVFYSCRTTKNIAEGKLMEELSADQLNTKIEQNKFHFTTFYASSKVNIESKPLTQNAVAIISMQQDSFIGISFRVLGLEGLKIFITKDSVKIIDRINRKYYPRDFKYIENVFAIPTDFQTLQDIITGDLVYYTGTMYPLVSDTCNCYRLNIRNGSLINTIKLFPTFDIATMFVEDLQNNRTMFLQYSDYKKVERVEQIGRQNFSFLRTIHIDAVDKYSMLLEFTDVTLDEPLDFTFTVNSKYEKVE